jgi:hypothetical protein
VAGKLSCGLLQLISSRVVRSEVVEHQRLQVAAIVIGKRYVTAHGTVFVSQLIMSNLLSSKVISLLLKSFEGSQVGVGMKIHTWLLPQMEFGRHISRYV